MTRRQRAMLVAAATLAVLQCCCIFGFSVLGGFGDEPQDPPPGPVYTT